jgi:hypothetical protein
MNATLFVIALEKWRVYYTSVHFGVEVGVRLRLRREGSTAETKA